MSESEKNSPHDLEERAKRLEHMAERQEHLAHEVEELAEVEREEARELLEEAHRLAKHEKETTIFVNGTEYKVEKRKISYEGLLKLIEAPPLPKDKRYLVQYSKGPKDKPTGTLIEGQSVELKNHMEFDVTPTNRS